MYIYPYTYILIYIYINPSSFRGCLLFFGVGYSSTMGIFFGYGHPLFEKMVFYMGLVRPMDVGKHAVVFWV